MSKELKQEIDTLTAELNTARAEIRQVLDKRDADEQNFENSEYGKELHRRIGEQDDIRRAYSKQLDKIHEDICHKYTDDGRSPRHSTTYGKNIKQYVFDAMKKHFDIKKLRGSDYEDIVENMISHEYEIDATVKDLRENQLKSRQKEREFSDEYSNALHKLKAKYEEATRPLSEKIKEIETKLGVLLAQLPKTKMREGIKEINKDAGDLYTSIDYQGQKAIQAYRMKCVSEYEKVFDTINTENKEVA